MDQTAFISSIPLQTCKYSHASHFRPDSRHRPAPKCRPRSRLPLPALPPAAPLLRTELIQTRKPALRRLLPVVPALLSICLKFALPATALATATLLRAPDATGFFSGLTAAFLLVLASEIGDKTFFISALLSIKYSRILVLLGTMLALTAMTVISVVIGQVFHALPASFNTAIPFDDYAAVALLLWFGWQNIRDARNMSPDDDDELKDAKGVVEGTAAPVAVAKSGVRVVAETTSLIFVAEWGDKSMLATVALAAAKSPLGVIVGGVTGHFIATIIAVVGGSFFGKFVSERTARLVAGVLFFVFAFLTVFSIY